MESLPGRVIRWTPRVICLAFALFLAMFALDVFAQPLDPARKALALLMHLIPSLLVLVTLALVWRRPWIGVLVFPLLALAHLVSMRGRLHWTGYLAIDGPLMLLALLFLIDWRTRGTVR